MNSLQPRIALSFCSCALFTASQICCHQHARATPLHTLIVHNSCVKMPAGSSGSQAPKS